jgi:tetratricopeptide (TPR) repeat protein
MAKKKGKSSKPKRSKAAEKNAGLSLKEIEYAMRMLGTADMPDVLRQSIRRTSGKLTPLDKAQDLVRQSHDADDFAEQVRLLGKALETCPDCAEAYLALGQIAPSERESIPLFEQALAAAERALGRELFEDAAGNFSSLFETRPYMEARLELARALWFTGRGMEAVDHLLEMLRLNPNDNQGVRYLLIPWLIELNRDAEALGWIRRFDERSTFWLFNEALCAFRREGDTDHARSLLAAARKSNRHVTPMLLGETPSVPMMFPMYSSGDEGEATTYISEAARAWRFTPGAVSWMRRAVAQASEKKGRQPRQEGPTASGKSRLKKRPLEYGEAWQAGVHQVQSWLISGGQPVRPWSVLIVNPADRMILFQEIVPFPPTANQLWNFVCQAVHSPLYGDPHRPSEIQVREEPAWEAIRPHLEEVGIDCIFPAEMEEFDVLIKDLDKFMAGDEDTSRAITHVRGVSTARAASLYESAAQFYRAAPWRAAADDLTIRVECPELTAAPAYAVVMGSGGMLVGLTVYRDLQSLHETRYPACDDPESIGQRVNAVTLMFAEPFEVAVPDLAAIEQQGWDIASPEAYPTFMSVRRERGAAMPNLAELTLLEACLRTVPAFVQRCPFLDPYSERQTISFAGRECTVILSWEPSLDSPCGDACTGHCEHS